MNSYTTFFFLTTMTTTAAVSTAAATTAIIITAPPLIDGTPNWLSESTPAMSVEAAELSVPPPEILYEAAFMT